MLSVVASILGDVTRNRINSLCCHTVQGGYHDTEHNDTQHDDNQHNDSL